MLDNSNLDLSDQHYLYCISLRLLDPQCSPDKQDFDREFINFPMNSCEGKTRQGTGK